MDQNQKEYKFDAFISYRHLEPDRSVARAVQTRLETYKPPKSVAEDFSSWRLFLDETELPSASNLSDVIEDALASSRFLIVICSPMLVKSMWCMREIDRFKELHGGRTDHIIAVIADGAPGEVIPPQLLHETFTQVDEKGGEKLVDRDVEPIAANVAAPTAKERSRLLKKEFLRIAAMLLGCEFNDLYDREKKRRSKRRAIIWGSAAALVTAIAVYSTSMLFIINTQKEELARANGALEESNSALEESNAALEESNESLETANHELWMESARSQTYLSESLFDQGDYLAALDYAYAAMPQEGSGEALLAETAKVLTDELEPYSEVIFRPVCGIEVEDNISEISLVGGGETLAVSYGSYVSFYNAADGALLNTVTTADLASASGYEPSVLTLCPPEKNILSGVPLESYTGDLLIMDDYGNYFAARKTEGSEEYDCSGNVLVRSSFQLAMIDGSSGEILWKVFLPDDETFYSTLWTGSGIFSSSDELLVRIDENTGEILESWRLDPEAQGVRISDISLVDGDLLCFAGIPADVYLGDYRHYVAVLAEGTISDVVPLEPEMFSNNYSCENLFSSGILIMDMACDIFGKIDGGLEVYNFDESGKLLWTYTDAISGYSSHMFAFFNSASETNAPSDTVVLVYNDRVAVVNAATGEVLDKRDLPGNALEAYGYSRGLTFIVTENGEEICLSTRNMTEGSSSTTFVTHQYLTELQTMDQCSFYGGTYASYYKELQKINLYRDIFHDYESSLSDVHSGLSFSVSEDGTYLAAMQKDGSDYALVIRNLKTQETTTIPGYDYGVKGLYFFDDILAVKTSDRVDCYEVESGTLLQAFSLSGMSSYSDNLTDGDDCIFCHVSSGNLLERLNPDGSVEEFPLESEEYASQLSDMKYDLTSMEVLEGSGEILFCYGGNQLLFTDEEGRVTRTGQLTDGTEIKGVSYMDGSLFVMCGNGKLLVVNPETLEIEKSCKIKDFGVLKSSCTVTIGKAEGRNLYLVSYLVTSGTYNGKGAQTCFIDADSFEVACVFDGFGAYSQVTDRVYVDAYNRIVSYPYFDAENWTK